jgi:hypothetical protein
MTAREALAALLVPLALLVACGDDSESSAADPPAAGSSSATDSPSATEPATSDDPSDTPPAKPAWPACSAVWVAGADIPGRYQGCLDGDDAVEADNLTCSSGQRIVRYADRFFGVAGGRIYQTTGPLDKDKEYLKKVRVCRA